jgi:hypothetical protein
MKGERTNATADLRRLGAWCGAAILITGLTGLARASGPVTTSIYTSYTDNFPTSISFSGSPVDSISTPDFQQFGSAVSWNWRPDSLTSFAADTTGQINVTTPGSFTFILAGVQDEIAYVDGTLTVTHGSDAVAQNQNTIPLTAGLHTIEVRYDIAKPANEFSGWEMSISPGNGFAIVPEPASCWIVAGGLALLLRRRVSLACRNCSGSAAHGGAGFPSCTVHSLCRRATRSAEDLPRRVGR